MKKFWLFVVIMMLPVLACGPSLSAQITPTPTKTPKRIRTVAPLETPTPVVIVLPTDTPVPTATFTPTPIPTETPTPPPTPTETPTPPPPTRPPAPPTQPPTPVPTQPPAQPTQPAATVQPTTPPSSGPTVVISLPDGDTYNQNDKVNFTITVSDPDGVATFTWGVFTENQSPVGLGDDKNCGNGNECSLSGNFKAKLTGRFIFGVDAIDTKGNKTRTIQGMYVS